MKSRILFACSILFSLLLLSNEGRAQEQDKLPELRKELKLNSTQFKKWGFINRRYDKLIKEVKSNSKLSIKEKAQKTDKLLSQQNAEIKALISDQQWAKLMKYRAAKRKKD